MNPIPAPQPPTLPPPPPGKTGWPWNEGHDAAQHISLTAWPKTAWPKISIITPSYNQAQFLERTIRSVLMQDYPNLEYIIMDGGSRDDSVAVIQKYADHIAYWESQKDRGQPHALNKSLTHCTGDIIAFINSDDFYLPGALRRVAQLFDQHPDAAWLGGVCRYYEEGVGYVDPGRYVAQMPPLPKDRSQWVDGWPTNQPSSFWRSKCFQKAGDFREDLDLTFDTEFMVRLLFADLLPMIVDDVFSVYVLHDSSKTVSQKGNYVAEADRFRPEYFKHLTRQEGQRLYWRLIVRGYQGRIKANRRAQAYGFVLRQMLAHPAWFVQGMTGRWRQYRTLLSRRRASSQRPAKA
ncbi:MAG: glycosyltransferase [Caldilineales bacterium]|nr:glycosyltransferase [Caldilineales bacterium]